LNALGAHERAIEVLEHNVSPAAIELYLKPRDLRPPVPPSFSVRSFALASLREFARATAEASEAVRVADTTGGALHQVTAWNAYGVVQLERGDAGAAWPFLERAVAASRSFEISFFFDRTAAALACAWAMSGRVADGLRLLDELRTRGVSMSHLSPAQTEAYVAEAYLVAGRIVEAGQAARRALHFALERREPGYEPRAHQVLGDVAAQAEPLQVEEVEGHYRTALGLGSALGLRPLIARCHLRLGTLYRRTGKRQDAQDHLATAIAMYREMDLRFWLEQAEVEMQKQER
jgi:tetratricopeptide (TPR) repeat protein